MKVTQHQNYVIRVWEAENHEIKKFDISLPGSRIASGTVRGSISLAVKRAVAMVDILVESQKS